MDQLVFQSLKRLVKGSGDGVKRLEELLKLRAAVTNSMPLLLVTGKGRQLGGFESVVEMAHRQCEESKTKVAKSID